MQPTDQLDADSLLILAKVIELKSISSAAAVLGIPRSTVSRRINQLEDNLGIKLLRKNTRKITVTDLGEEIYRHAINIENEMNAIRAVLSSRKQEPQGVLRVAMPVFMGVDFASRLGALFLQKNPKARLEMRFVDAGVHPIKDGFDVTLAYGPLEDSALIGKKLFEIESLLCASPEFAKQIPDKVNQPEKLLEYPFIDAGHDSGVFKLHLKKGRRQVEITPHVRAQANNFQVGKHYVLQGMGIGALPKHLCISELARKKLVPLLSDWKLERRDVFLLYPFQLTYSKLISAFYDAAYNTMRGYIDDAVSSPAMHDA